MENCIRDPRRQHHHWQSLAGSDERSRFGNAFVTSSRFNSPPDESAVAADASTVERFNDSSTIERLQALGLSRFWAAALQC
jgi:hypothetical protein